jgi:hypothetical protein
MRPQRGMAAAKKPSKRRLRAERPCRGRLTIDGGAPGGRSAIVNESIVNESISNEPIVNWPATPRMANTRNLPDPQRNGHLAAQDVVKIVVQENIWPMMEN